MAKIFVIDNKESGNRDVYEGLLHTGGHDVLCTSGGGDTLKPLFTFKPDVIIFDVLDGDMTYFGKVKDLRKLPNFSNTPVLMVLNDSAEEINLAIVSGSNDYIIKPIRESELTSRLGVLLNKNNLFSNEFTPGTFFANRYKINSLLGKGGDSTVYNATDKSKTPEEEVALKILKVKDDAAALSPQFERETNGLAGLDHHNIVKLLDHGCYDGAFYLTTEFIKGSSLGDIIKESPLIEESAIDLALEVAEALKYINQFGIVHRDIKPDNILISHIGEVKLVDFGLSREEHQQTVSIKGEMFGTPQYLAPEYIDGKKLNIRTDIYSLGITLFYMVSGALPFQAGTPMALLSKQLNETPPMLNEITDDVSKDFADLINKMLIKDPEERISLDEMVAGFKAMKTAQDNEE